MMEDKTIVLDLITQKIPELDTKEGVFNLVCEISKITERCTFEDLQSLYSCNNLYVEPIWNVFHNKLFTSSLQKILNASYEDLLANKVQHEQEIVQVFLRLSFFMVSVLAPVLTEETFLFLRKHFGTSLKHIRHELSDSCNMRQLLLTLERINYNAKYRLSKKTQVVLDRSYLNMNQISSRILVGSLLISSINYWALPRLFKEVTQQSQHPAKLFKTAKHIKYKTDYYHNTDRLLNESLFDNNRRSELISLISVLRDQNVDDLIYLISEVDPKYGETEREHSALRKIEDAAVINNKIQARFKKLGVFKHNNVSGNEWSNKAFLNTIELFSVLEAINKAKDVTWKANTFDYFINRWLRNMNEIVNYYYTDDAETIAVYVEGQSDKIILENAYEKLHPNHNNFIFYHMGGKQELFKKINAVQISDLEKQSIGIFDFDDAYDDFNGLRSGNEEYNTSGFSEIRGNEKDCLFRSRDDNTNCVHAILLPVPDSRREIASRKYGSKSILSIELLFEDDLLRELNNLGQETVTGGTVVNVFAGDKLKFANKTKEFKVADYKNFEPLFIRLIGLSQNKE